MKEFDVHNAGKTNPAFKGTIIGNVRANDVKAALKLAKQIYGSNVYVSAV